MLQIVPTSSLTASPDEAGPYVQLTHPSPPVLPSGHRVLTPSQQTRSLEDLTEAIRDIWRRNCASLDDQQQMKLLQLLWEFKDIFALNNDEVGLTHLAQHHSETHGAAGGCRSGGPCHAPVRKKSFLSFHRST